MSELYKKIQDCRICGGNILHPAMNLGQQALTGRFPGPNEPDPPMAPLELVRCGDCGLVQLRHSVAVNEMFGDGYGYKSGTNITMRNHLGQLALNVSKVAGLTTGDVVLDIGCNDGTLLTSYAISGLTRLGIDPIAENFRDEYREDLNVASGYFTAEVFASLLPNKKASAITSISMFYDLERPAQFVADIAGALAAEGIWILEQSYLPAMLDKNSFDTICHEHLEYYALAQIDRLVGEAGLRVFDVQLNDINGGSFQVWVCHSSASYAVSSRVELMRQQEAQLNLLSDEPFAKFRQTVDALKLQVKEFVSSETAKGKKFYVYGASTKGNVLLQNFGLDHSLLSGCADRNPTKWGRRTPGTSIPIVSEEDARLKADYFLVLPWHFRDEFVQREARFIADGGALIFPLPTFEVVRAR